MNFWTALIRAGTTGEINRINSMKILYLNSASRSTAAQTHPPNGWSAVFHVQPFRPGLALLDQQGRRFFEFVPGSAQCIQAGLDGVPIPTVRCAFQVVTGLAQRFG